MRGFLRWMIQSGKSGRSANHHLIAVREFFRFLVLEGVREDNPARQVKGVREVKRQMLPLTQEQVSKLLEPSGNVRDDAILEVFYGSGLRVSELCDLELANVNLDEGTAYVTGKGNRERKVPLSLPAIAAIRSYLPSRHRSDSRFLFTSDTGSGPRRQYGQICSGTPQLKPRPCMRTSLWR